MAEARAVDGVLCNGMMVLLALDSLVTVDDSGLCRHHPGNEASWNYLWVFGCLIQCRIGTVSRIIFGIAWELFDIWTHLTLHKFKEDKQEGLTQQLISDMFLKMTLTLGLQNGRCDDCDVWIWINFPVVRHCHLPKVFFRKSCWRRSVSPLPIHQHLCVFSWRVDPRGSLGLPKMEAIRVKHRSSQLMQLPWNWCPKGCVTRCRRRTAKIPNGAWLFWCKLSRPHHCACQLI